MKIVELTKENFDEEVLAASVPVLIDFWATWCAPCQMQSPIVDAVAEEMGDKVKVCKVNVDEQPKLAMNYQIANIPTLVYMKLGQFKSRMVGLQDQETITDYLNQLLTTEE
ncbi:MAG: thioredoxin [Muribaculaceae bacterium]|nr:thioredoxin [Roseburia sp.]MCM1430531.1 thioredoxin [Muribaculaceae bacterium]MCM1492638.1 thioredoxin [Muribaculaceae bacterium]